MKLFYRTPPTQFPPIPSRSVYGILGAITLIAFILRLYNFTYADYWNDEIISLFAARQSPFDLLQTITVNDTHPPLYHMLLHLWISLFGESLSAIRIFSVIISTLCIPCIYILGATLTEARVGIIAAAFVAVNPFQILHSHQARMYPLLTLVVLATVIFFLKAWRANQRGYWLALAGMCIAGFYTHVYFSFSLFALNLVALYDTVEKRTIDWRRWGWLIGVQFVAVLFFLPFLATMAQLTSSIIQNFWIPPLNPVSVVIIVINFINFGLAMQGVYAPWMSIFSLTISLIAIALMFAISVRSFLQKEPPRTAIATLHILCWTPILLAILLSLTLQSILIDRSIIACGPMLLILIAYTLNQSITALARYVLILFIILSGLFSLPLVYATGEPINEMRVIADTILTQRRSDDLIALSGWEIVDRFAFQYPDEPQVYILSSPGSPPIQWQQRMAIMQWQAQQGVGGIETVAPRYRRVWVVITTYTSALGYHQLYTLDWLSAHGRLIEQREYGRATLYMYEMGGR